MSAGPGASNRVTAALLTGILLMLVVSIPMAVRAQSPASGRQVALEAVQRCPDRVKAFDVLDITRQFVAGQWVTIAGPLFGKDPSGPRDAIVAHAVDPRDPMRQFASNGRSIERSVDGGCTWREVHFVPPATPELILNRTGLGDSVLQLGIAEGGPAPGRVWALVGPLEETVAAVRVFVSDDGGDTWEERSAGLPAAHTRTDTTLISPAVGAHHPAAVLALAPSNADTAYIGLSSSLEGDGPVYATEDGGRTWFRPGVLNTTVEVQGQITEMAVDPAAPRSLWVLGGNGAVLMHSDSGGAAWETISLGSAGNAVDADGLHVSRRGGTPHVQVLGSSGLDGASTLYRSTDGRQFVPRNLVEPVRGDAAVSAGGDPDEMVMSTDGPDQAFGLDVGAPGGTTFRNIATPGLGDVNAPQADRTSEPAQWFRQYGGLAAYVPGSPPGVTPPLPRVLPDRLFDRLQALRGRGARVPGTLSPNPLDLELPEQGTETVDYVLDLPPLPTPVDVWFLMDTSGSMGGAIEGLQLGIDRIVKELKAAGLDAWFGVAEYKGENYRYARLADIGPPDEDFESGLRRLYASGGGEETQYTALYQTVTSAGQEDVGIDPGQGASFRPEALKIIVHASDEPFGEIPDGPTPEEAGVAMNEMGVFHVGLDFSAGAQGVSTTPPTRTVKEDMDEMARATGTFAPREGVDCNGDGQDELQPGEPLTCPIVRGEDDVDISEPIISAVRAVRDETAVGLTVEDPAGIEVDIADPLRVPVNVKVPNQLPFSVRFTCPASMNGDVANVKLLATVRGADSAQATANVMCGTPPPAIRPVPGPLAPVVPFIATPPQLVPELETALSPLNQPSPAQVAAPSAQPGIATQPGQVATAQQKSGRSGPPEPPREESSRDSGESRGGLPSGAAGTLGAGAAMAVAFGGWAVAQSRARRPARQRA
ncbi:MAG TPA: hypothetical protein VMY88_09965 [Acidimicrobiales bacterium]|nr:hypothetical protein [Acidimicrobiales bacterium]